MSSPHENAAWKVHPHVRFRRVLDEAVVIHQERAEALVLNETAARFLELCDGEQSFEEIVAKMAAEYDVDPRVLSVDVSEFAQDLLQEGIIEAP